MSAKSSARQDVVVVGAGRRIMAGHKNAQADKQHAMTQRERERGKKVASRGGVILVDPHSSLLSFFAACAHETCQRHTTKNQQIGEAGASVRIKEKNKKEKKKIVVHPRKQSKAKRRRASYIRLSF